MESPNYMTVGSMYRLHGMSKNVLARTMRISTWHRYSNQPFTLERHRRWSGAPRPDPLPAGEYTDGALFLCVKTINTKPQHTLHQRGYILLTPDGQLTYLPHARNKTKFKECKTNTRAQ